jgi:hypothetical protein
MVAAPSTTGLPEQHSSSNACKRTRSTGDCGADRQVCDHHVGERSLQRLQLLMGALKLNGRTATVRGVGGSAEITCSR